MGEELIRVARLSELKDMNPVSIVIGRVPYCVVKVDDSVKAYITVCSHEYIAFTPRVKQDCLVCPRHQVCFEAASGRVSDFNGRKVPEGLRPVATDVRDGFVYIVALEEHRFFMAQSAERAVARRARKRRRRWFDAFGWWRK